MISPSLCLASFPADDSAWLDGPRGSSANTSAHGHLWNMFHQHLTFSQWNLKKHTEGDDEGAAHLREPPTSSWTPSAAPLWHRSPLWFPLEYESGCVPRHLLPGCRCTPPGTVWTELPVWNQTGNEDINDSSLLFERLHYTGPLINLRFSFESSELCFNYELLIANKKC